ncbi:MAG TPA: hypothetical protein VI431_00200 [Candidatus Acidoferrum sp.]
MPKRWLSFFVIMVFAALSALSAANSAKGTDSRSFGLGLSLRADRSVYRMSDTLRLETLLRNTGEEDVYIWQWDMSWNPAKGLSMHIVRANGKEVQTPFLMDSVPPPPRGGDPYQFVKLSPRTMYGLAENFKLEDLVNGPGEYDLDATFNSFLSSQWVAEFMGNEPISKLPLWTMERPSINSNRIHITVRP